MVSSLGALLVRLGSLKTFKNGWVFLKHKKEKVNFTVSAKKYLRLWGSD